MTTPVINKMRATQCPQPWQGMMCPYEQKKCFYISPEHWVNTPQPYNPTVTVETLPEMTVYVRYVICGTPSISIHN